jgi:hypothetical protein
MEVKLKKQLLDFDATQLSAEECVFKWDTIAQEVGFSESFVRRFCAENSIKLPRWGLGMTGGPVYLPKLKVPLLRSMILSTR